MAGDLLEHSPSERPGEPGSAVLRGSQQHVDPEVPGLHPVGGTHGIGVRLVGLEDPGGGAVELQEPRVVGGGVGQVRVDLLDLLTAEPGHAPEARAGCADPLVDHGGVVRGIHGAQPCVRSRSVARRVL